MPVRKVVRARITAVFLAALASLVVAAPAGAFLRDLTVKNGSSPTSSSTTKSDLVSVAGCPGPIIGGAISMSPAFPNLGVQQLMPFGGLLFGASETDSEAGAWTVNARAFCVRNTGTPPPAGAAGPYLKGLTYALGATGNNSNPLKTVIVTCPAGRTVISGGGQIASVGSDLALTSMGRVKAGTGWRVTGREVDATNVNWQLSAVAVCANVTTETATADYLGNAVGPAFGFAQIFNPPSTFTSVSPRTIVRTCPPGTRVVGGGARVAGNQFGDPAPSDVAITRSEPGSSTTWVAEARETDPTNSAWRINANISCATTNGGPPA
jgi:hypothetical protein